MIEKHFVTFVSPGTFMPETTCQGIDSWNVNEATKMARTIIERYNATPYSFHFTTHQNDGDLDSKEVARSCNYFLGGTVLTLADIQARNDPADRILIGNMKGNNITRVVENCNSWGAVLPLNKEDIILDYEQSQQSVPQAKADREGLFGSLFP